MLLLCIFVVVDGFMVLVSVVFGGFMVDYKAIAMGQVFPLG